MSQPSTLLLSALALLGFIAAYIYLVGIPPEMKRKMEKKALETMGENKASYMLKDQIGKVPSTGDRDLDGLKNNVGNIAGRVMKNPLGDQAGERADDLTKPLTGR
ncbi:hypothetical protein EJ06DRAFT_505083 [Trichodelitschia bisporula]|uniref:Uncharacterized protein n=1 Tax=Trichodelitschia bisporula TaxID=703511 RepID=A0A6G1I649_9PEZI|nr:hypothetical protein EJ06DRAFT_505083 [Trichodelitschia bisporula]